MRIIKESRTTTTTGATHIGPLSAGQRDAALFPENYDYNRAGQ
jgi:hypothetical protein